MRQVIISSFAVSGTGTALATAAIEQDRAYYEVRILKLGTVDGGTGEGGRRRTNSLLSHKHARTHARTRGTIAGVIRIGVSHRPEKRTRLAKPIGDNRTSNTHISGRGQPHSLVCGYAAVCSLTVPCGLIVLAQVGR